LAIRTTLSNVARQAAMSSSRATVREFDDDHLMQQVKYADVFHSETPSDFERWQMIGMTAFPIKQQEDEQKQQPQKASQDQQGDWNHDQPTGPAAEALMLYLNGSRSHPVALVDDRRVRPYGMSEGEGAHYAPDGSEQMVLFKETGTYVVSLDGPSVKDKKSNKTRFVSLRHVSKKMQTHKIDSSQQSSSGQSSGSGASAQQLDTSSSGSGGGQQQKYKHEGDSVNTEIRATKDKIEIRDGDTVVGVYDKQAKSWTFSNFKKLTLNADDEMNFTSKKITVTATSGALNLNGKPINFNGGGPTSPPFTVPG
jgi:phage gp45-like